MPEDTSLVPVMGDGYTSAYDSLHALKNAITISAPDALYWYVDYTDGDDTNDGKSWDDAFATLTKAIAEATTNTGDMIFVRNDGTESVTVPSTKTSLKIVGIDFPTITGDLTVAGGSTSFTGVQITGNVAMNATDIDFSGCTIGGDITGSAANGTTVRRLYDCQVTGAVTIGEDTIIDKTLIVNTGGTALTVRGDAFSSVTKAIVRSSTLVGSIGINIGSYVSRIIVSNDTSIYATTIASGTVSAILWGGENTFYSDGTITPTGAEQTLYEETASDSNRTINGIYIDLSNMVASDVTTIRLYVVIKSAGAFVLMDSTQYNDALAEPLVFVDLKIPFRYGFKVTIETTVTSDIDYEVF